jgi:uncharacterized protein (DUF58 family)
LFPTKRGLAMLSVGVVLYGLAWQTQIGWFYVADALVVAIFVVNLPLPWLVMRSLSASRAVVARQQASGDLFEDDTLSISTTLHNASLIPKSLITLAETCPLAGPDEREQGFLIAAIGPGGNVDARYEATCYKRGVFSFDPVAVHTSAPFGLFKAGRILDAPLEVTVYPRVLPMTTTFNQGFHQGQMPDNSPPVTSGEFRGSREFQQGDRIRNIHWRNSARSGRLMVKEFDRTPQGEVRLALNPEIEAGQGRDTTLEYGVKIAASVAHRCFGDGRPFRMWPAGDGDGPSTWHGVLEHLARLQPEPSDAAGELMSHGGGQGLSILVVSAADVETLSMAAEASSSQQSIAVLLEGFGPNEREDAASVLERTGFFVVKCRPGELPQAIDSLSAAMETTRPMEQPVRA